MDRIDSFIIYGKQKDGEIEFTFLLLEEDINYLLSIVDYIDSFVRKLNKRIPQFSFTWRASHRIKPSVTSVYEEIIHQVLVQR